MNQEEPLMAYCLIKVEPGLEKDVYKSLEKIPEVKEAYMVYGIFDIVAKIRAKDEDKLKGIIEGKIRKIDGIYTTSTLPIVC